MLMGMNRKDEVLNSVDGMHKTDIEKDSYKRQLRRK